MTRKIFCAAALLVAGAFSSPEARANTYVACYVYSHGHAVAGCSVILGGPLNELNLTVYFRLRLACNADVQRTWTMNSQVVAFGDTFFASQVRHILNTGEGTPCTIAANVFIHAIITYLTIASDDAWGIYNAPGTGNAAAIPHMDSNPAAGTRLGDRAPPWFLRTLGPVRERYPESSHDAQSRLDDSP